MGLLGKKLRFIDPTFFMKFTFNYFIKYEIYTKRELYFWLFILPGVLMILEIYLLKLSVLKFVYDKVLTLVSLVTSILFATTGFLLNKKKELTKKNKNWMVEEAFMVSTIYLIGVGVLLIILALLSYVSLSFVSSNYSESTLSSLWFTNIVNLKGTIDYSFILFLTSLLLFFINHYFIFLLNYVKSLFSVLFSSLKE